MTLVRRVVAALCVAIAAAVALGVPEKFRFAVGWAWAWELPGPLAWMVMLACPLAFLLCLPDLLALGRGGLPLTVALLTSGLLLVAVGSVVCAAHAAAPRPRQILRLENHEGYAIDVRSGMSGSPSLWMRDSRSGRWALVSESPGIGSRFIWPLEVRSARSATKYLMVDSMRRGVAELELTDEREMWHATWRVGQELPSLREMRSAFGDDLVGTD